MSDQDVNPEHISDAQPAGTGLVLPGQPLPTTLYVIPIHNRPFFPAQVLPVIVNEEPWAETLELVAKTDHHSLALFFMDNPPEDPRHFDVNSLPEHGTLVRVHHASREGGKLQFVAQGLSRVRIRGWIKRHRPPFMVEVDYPKTPIDPSDEVKAYGMALINAIKEAAAAQSAVQRGTEELPEPLQSQRPVATHRLRRGPDHRARRRTAGSAGHRADPQADGEGLAAAAQGSGSRAPAEGTVRRGQPQDRRTPARILPQGTVEDHPAGGWASPRTTRAPTPTNSAPAWKARCCPSRRASVSTKS